MCRPRSVHDLARHGNVPRIAERRVETREQGVDGFGPGQPLPERPDRLGVRNSVLQAKAEEAHETAPVADKELRPVIAQIVLRLDDQDLEHENRVIGPAPALPAIRLSQSFVQIAPEYLEIHRPCRRLELITEITQALEPGINITKSSLSDHPKPRCSHVASDSSSDNIGEVNRGPQVVDEVTPTNKSAA